MADGFDVDLAALAAVGQFIASEVAQLSGINLASVSDMLSMSVEGIDTGRIADGADDWTTTIRGLAQNLSAYGHSIGEVARTYGASDDDVRTAMGGPA